jgi:uncharacterized membrane protein
MASITTPIDKVEQFLGHSPHPAIVMLPLGAWTVSAICDLAAFLTRRRSKRRSLDDTSRISMGIGLVGAAGAVATGLRDYAGIKRDSPSHPVATRHAIGNAIAGTLFTTSFTMRRLAHAEGRSTPLVARVLCLAGACLGMYTGWLGGKLVEEFGEGVKPVMESQGALGQQATPQPGYREFEPSQQEPEMPRRF